MSITRRGAIRMPRQHGLFALPLVVLAAAAGYWLLRPRVSGKPANVSRYADPQSCVRCHRDEAAGYGETGMAHAFSEPTAATTVANPSKAAVYFHPASSTWFKLTAHDGRFFERRWQKGFDGQDDNVEELSIDYVMGSGHHARTFLHREQDGTLVELPLAWYAENGGEFAMNPGFDNATPDTRRAIAYECMFCHNGYPEIPATEHRDLSAKPVYGAALPMGIDCQRCHGPGAEHVEAAEAAKPDTARLRVTILNPANLSNERQMQVCEQCHLETTSALLPDRIRHYDQQPFGYDPNHPLSDFNAYFKPAGDEGPTSRVEIVNAAYRLRQSKCFLASGGALTCERCHNPHDLHRGPQSAGFYADICLSCHSGQIHTMVEARAHPDSKECVACHMPQRRTSDVVHAVMTDHLIQRRRPAEGEALAPLQEATSRYFGPVLRYRLDGEVPGPDDGLYDALAQVIDGSHNAAAPQLATALDQQKPHAAEFYIELGDAERHNGHLDAAIATYRKAMELDPQSSRGARRLGVALGLAGQSGEALQILGQGILQDPKNEFLFYERAQLEARMGNTAAAVSDLREALGIRPDYADALNNLGSLLAQSESTKEAESYLRQALSVNPYDAGTHANLGRLLNAEDRAPEALFQFQRAAQLEPANTELRLDFATLLLSANRSPQAESEVQAVLRIKPGSARALDLSGQIAMARGRREQALAFFQASAKADPEFAPAQLDLGAAYLAIGKRESALPWLERAQRSSLSVVADRARELLNQSASSR